MGKKSKRSKRQQPGQHAPLKGVGETYNWLVNDVAVINARLTQDAQLTVSIACDVNGFNYTVYNAQTNVTDEQPSAAAPIVGQQFVYGDANDQFARLSMLWQEYRVNKISMHVVPAGPAGPLQASGNYSLIDEPGALQRTDARAGQTETQLIPELSSQRSFTIHEPYKVTNREFNLNKWLIQTQDECWKQTKQPNFPTVVRQPYLTPVNSTTTEGQTPGLLSVIKFNATPGGSWNGVLCNVLFKTHYVFRQRRVLDPLDDLIVMRKADGIHVNHLSTTQKDKIQCIIENNITQAQDQVETPPVLSASTIEHLKSLIK